MKSGVVFFSTVMVVLLTGAFCPTASANDDVAFISDVIQVEQTVCVVIQADSGGITSYNLVRESDEETKSLLEGNTADCSITGSIDLGCWSGPDEEYCAENPDMCVDCDGDEVPECPDWCYIAEYATVPDLCAPAGAATYKFEYEYGSDETDFEITESGSSCETQAASLCLSVIGYGTESDLPAPDQCLWNNASVDDDSDDSDDDDDDGGCGCNVAASDDAKWPLANGMLILGLVFALLARNKKH